MKHLIALAVVLLLLIPSAWAEKPLVVAQAIKDQVMTGYTRCAKSVTLTSEVAGKALKVHYKTGDTIGKELFFEIDPTFINLALETNRLQTRQMEARIKSMTSKLAYLNKSLKRVKALRKNKNISEAKYDEAASRYNETLYELEALKLEKDVLRRENIRLTEKKSRHNISCFEGWRVVALHVEEGESVQPGTPLAEISDYNTLVVPFSLSGEEVNAFRALPESFNGTLDGAPVKARIDFINPKFDEQTRKLELELAISDYSGDRRGGLKFTTRIRVETDGVLLPRTAVRNRFGNPKVALKKTGEIVPVMILGESGDNLIVAKSDKLSPGTELLPATTPVSGG